MYQTRVHATDTKNTPVNVSANTSTVERKKIHEQAKMSTEMPKDARNAAMPGASDCERVCLE